MPEPPPLSKVKNATGPIDSHEELVDMITNLEFI